MMVNDFDTAPGSFNLTPAGHTVRGWMFWKITVRYHIHMTELDAGTILDQFVVPFYMDFIGGNFYRFSKQPKDSKDRVDFENRICAVLDGITPDIVNVIFDDHNWRSQLMGSWYCAIKDWRRFTDHIGNALLEDRSGYAGIGYCLALYSFADEASTGYLCKYLDVWLTRDESSYQGDAMQSLLLIDHKHGTSHRMKYDFERGPWQTWLAGGGERGKTGMFIPVLGLEYLRELTSGMA